jgi:hypothetical protein
MTHDPISLLLSSFDRAYDQRSWHGTNLRGSVRGLTASQASFRPAPRRHSIVEIVLHAAYWKYAVRRRLLGEKRGAFPLKGSNWFPRPEGVNDNEWKEAVKLLDNQHRQLRSAITTLSPEDLPRVPPGSKVSNLMILEGIAAHDLYHAGQIQLLKALQKRT